MFIIHLNNELIYFSQKSPYLSISACPYLSISWLRAQTHISHFNLTSFNVCNTKDFKLNFLTPIFSGATERRRKLEILEIWRRVGEVKHTYWQLHSLNRFCQASNLFRLQKRRVAAQNLGGACAPCAHP